MDCYSADWIDHWVGDLKPGRALDLGPGSGACSIWLARRGFTVDAVEREVFACSQIERSAAGLDVTVYAVDVRDFDYPTDEYDIILAQAVLHFLMPSDLWLIADRIASGLKPGGYLFAEVFSTDDPGYTASRDLGLSELEPNTFFEADWGGVLHYFTSGELKRVFHNLICLEYEESRSRDQDAHPGYRASASLVARKAV